MITPANLNYARMSVRQALVEIAKVNGGAAAAADTFEILVRAGFYRDVFWASQGVYSVLRRAKDFTREGPGTYRLK